MNYNMLPLMYSPLPSSTLEKRKKNNSAEQKVADWNSLRILDMLLNFAKKI